MRTNQFDVAERLGGIKEKFRVLNNDELADALYSRTTRLAQYQQRWLPDILDLLLHLSDNPMKNSRIEDLGKLSVIDKSLPPLRWIDLDRDDPFDRKDPIWRDVAFEAYSSEEEAYSDTPLVSPEHQTREIIEIPPSTAALVQTDAHDFDSQLDVLSSAHFWNITTTQIIPISELDAIKETLFALQGLPNAVYWRVGDKIELDKRYALNHCSATVFQRSLDDFSGLLVRLDVARRYARQGQQIPFLRAFQAGVNGFLLDFDKCVSSLQIDITNLRLQRPISLSSILQMVKSEAKVVLSIADFLASSKQDPELVVLDELFRLVCRMQLLGEEEFLPVCALFTDVFNTFFRSIRDCLECGTFTDSIDRLPRFMESFAGKMRLVSKTSVLLGETSNYHHDENTENSTIPNTKNSLEPFAERFLGCISQYIDERLHAVTTLLKEHMGHHLEKGLEALSYLYLAKDGRLTATIDDALFKRIDNCKSPWNDRFFLNDLVRATYAGVACIDKHRLSTRTSSKNYELLRKYHKPVQILADFSIVYTLPKVTAYIIQESSSAKYQGVATMLIQIRRAIYVLERRCRFKIKGRQAVRLCQDLLFFARTIYDHFTSFTIDSSRAQLLESLEQAADIDTMTRAHAKFLDDILGHCLVADRFAPLKDALLAVLHLCTELSDLVASGSKSKAPDHDRSGSNEDIDSATNMQSSSASLVRQLHDIKAQFETHCAFFIAGLRGVGRTQHAAWEMLARKLDWKGSPR